MGAGILKKKICFKYPTDLPSGTVAAFCSHLSATYLKRFAELAANTTSG